MLVKSILSLLKNEFYKESRKATLFESTSRNFVMERFLYFYYLCSMPRYDSISYFIKASKFRAPPSRFFALIDFLRLNRRKHAAWLHSYSCNFLTDFLHLDSTRQSCDVDPFPAICVKFQVSFRKVPADAYAHIYSCRCVNCNRRLRIGKV